ncbi:MAG: hypothetical protein K2Q22_00240, partial [Cytophagales bacterium]|nr:hypothetical protein [Cytophagales bacterium]
MQDTENGKKRLLSTGGRRVIYQEQNYTMPLVAWRNESVFSVISPLNGKFAMKTYEIKFLETKKIVKENGKARFETTKKPVGIVYKGKLPFQAFDFINSYDYSDDGRNIVFSADKEGQSDIFMYEIARGGGYRQITNDKFDDLYPRFIKNSNAIVFSSNRTNDTLGETDQERLSYLNLFTYDPSKPRLVQKLRTSPHNEIQPLSASGQEIYFLSDESGIYNIFKYDTVSKSTSQVTRFDNGITDYDYSPALGKLSFVAPNRAKEFLYVYPSFVADTLGLAPKTMRQEANEARNPLRYEIKPKETEAKESSVKIDSSSLDEVDINNYVFESEKKAKSGKKGFLVSGRKGRKSDQRINLFGDQFSISGPNPKIDFLRTNYIATNPFYIDNFLGWMLSFQAGAVDMMGNHQLNGGYSIRPLDILSSFRSIPSNNMMFAEYSYLGWRADLKLRYDRKQYSIISQSNNIWQV